MAKIAYCSTKHDSFLSSLGFEYLPYSKQQDFHLWVKHAISQEVAILVVSEAIYKSKKKEIDKFNQDKEITIMILPAVQEYGDLGDRRLDELLELAVGISTRKGAKK